jgi:hypothetical protein
MVRRSTARRRKGGLMKYEYVGDEFARILILAGRPCYLTTNEGMHADPVGVAPAEEVEIVRIVLERLPAEKWRWAPHYVALCYGNVENAQRIRFTFRAPARACEDCSKLVNQATNSWKLGREGADFPYHCPICGRGHAGVNRQKVRRRAEDALREIGSEPRIMAVARILGAKID